MGQNDSNARLTPLCAQNANRRESCKFRARDSYWWIQESPNLSVGRGSTAGRFVEPAAHLRAACPRRSVRFHTQDKWPDLHGIGEVW